ncbi:hypothetical protein [Peptacetobacter hiranonis]|uniref:Uncharacterized protein n=1 Tax=Peptacetobacter hiranonis (strain DSM 13275 / JCM 10541 / KCTC 15199 / TO-931) TaxID=500633 RepID=B6FZX4_PEPHT|nr:hypothetical protein [Peptacetobacter hiranonis]EEA84947.1 hypothetical protein CLOHIR_01428 [Peptacetobacter hiranonis DSM 13275]QEK20791.1 hypothetical protein KGNDJEFE_01278 [Peptacetobacter hiranonis]
MDVVDWIIVGLFSTVVILIVTDILVYFIDIHKKAKLENEAKEKELEMITNAIREGNGNITIERVNIKDAEKIQLVEPKNVEVHVHSERRF